MRVVGVHYQFLYDNAKPEVKIDPKGNTSIEYANGKSGSLNINDKEIMDLMVRFKNNIFMLMEKNTNHLMIQQTNR